MKETPIFEEVFMQLVRQPGFGLRLVVGGLLCFIPIVNLFALGYLYRSSLRLRRSGSLKLPNWEDWSGLFVDGLRFFVPWLVYWLLPCLAFGLLALILVAINLAALAYLLFVAGMLVTPFLFCAALYRLQTRSDFKDLLDVSLIFRMAWSVAPDCIIPALVVVGTVALLLPFYGFWIFLGFLLLIIHTGICFRRMEHRGAVRI